MRRPHSHLINPRVRSPARRSRQCSRLQRKPRRRPRRQRQRSARIILRRRWNRRKRLPENRRNPGLLRRQRRQQRRNHRQPRRITTRACNPRRQRNIQTRPETLRKQHRIIPLLRGRRQQDKRRTCRRRKVQRHPCFRLPHRHRPPVAFRNMEGCRRRRKYRGVLRRKTTLSQFAPRACCPLAHFAPQKNGFSAGRL